MEIVAATNNLKKLVEIRRLLETQGHTVHSLNEIGLEIDPEETGDTFLENSMIKATAVCKASGHIALSDDSGLVVDALDGAPGVYSARYAGEAHDDDANNEKLLKELEGVPDDKRTARFVSTAVLVFPDGTAITAEGICEGKIGTEFLGENGFGYDPLFLVDGKSFAQMSDEEKDTLSHRGKALKNLSSKLRDFSQKEDNDI